MRKLPEIVTQVRKEFEAGTIDTMLLARLYEAYAPLPMIDIFISQSKKMFPHLNCGLATVYLQHILQEGEIVRGKYHQHNHTFLLLPGNMIIDITADQFGGPAQYIGILKKPWTLYA